MRAIYYIKETGKITKCVDAIYDVIVANKNDDEEFIEGYVENFNNYLILNGQAVLKQEFDLIINGNVISNIPNNTTVVIGLQSPVVVNDGEIELVGNYNEKIVMYFYNDLYISKNLELNYEAIN